MRAFPIAVALVICGPASAEPVPTSDTCLVAVMRAPDDVRQVIEIWVHAEPRCTTLLEVRVVPTDYGLYLYARSPDGRVRERIVPDAQSAGVLVASWTADDWVEPSTVGPGTLNPRVQPVIAEPVAAPITSRRVGRWLAIDGMMMTSGSGATGVRAQLDLARLRGWTIGVAASALRTDDDIEGDGHLQYDERGLIAQLGFAQTFGGWELRVGGGVGIARTKAEGHVMDYGTGAQVPPEYEISTTTLELGYELSGQLWRRFGNLAVGGGPLATLVPQRVVNGAYPGEYAKQLSLVVLGGLRIGL